jgi:hypothetical protein
VGDFYATAAVQTAALSGNLPTFPDKIMSQSKDLEQDDDSG